MSRYVLSPGVSFLSVPGYGVLKPGRVVEGPLFSVYVEKGLLCALPEESLPEPLVLPEKEEPVLAEVTTPSPEVVNAALNYLSKSSKPVPKGKFRK